MIRAVFFASALSPLLFVIAIRIWGRTPLGDGMAIALMIASLGSLALLAIAITRRRNVSAQPFLLTSVKDESELVPGYLATYIVPLVLVDISTWQDASAYAILTGLLLILLARTNIALVNPFLLLAGFHSYRVTTSDSLDLVLLSKTAPHPNQTVLAVCISGTTYKAQRID